MEQRKGRQGIIQKRKEKAQKRMRRKKKNTVKERSLTTQTMIITQTARLEVERKKWKIKR